MDRYALKFVKIPRPIYHLLGFFLNLMKPSLNGVLERACLVCGRHADGLVPAERFAKASSSPTSRVPKLAILKARHLLLHPTSMSNPLGRGKGALAFNKQG